MVRTMMVAMNGGLSGYLLSHWQGRQSLAWSFWVNLVLVRCLILLMEGIVRIQQTADPWRSGTVAVAVFIVAHVGVYAWQIVGVVRAGDRYRADYGSAVVTWSVHLCIAISMLFTLASMFSTVQTSVLQTGTVAPDVFDDQDRDAGYVLALSEDRSHLVLSGDIEHGLTEKMAVLLHRHPEVAALLLESPGGNIYEARGLAILILRYGLDTHVDGTCASACTLAFIAGATRTLGQAGRLGFHSYRLDANYPIPFTDPTEEQRRDRAFFASRGVHVRFLSRMFDAPPSGLWFPDRRALELAGVIHELRGRQR